MRKVLLALTTVLALTTTVEAALPPLYQTSKEIKDILGNPEFDQKLHSGEVIESIQKNDKGYLVSTNYNTLQVNIIYQKTERIGPAAFTLQFEEPVPLSKK